MHVNDPDEDPIAPITFGATVTIFFSDIRGFTEFTETYGDEAAYRMLQHHNGLVKEQIALYGGQVVKTLGDSFMVSFTSARTAIQAAVGIQRRLIADNGQRPDPTIEVGIGINTGEPVLEDGDYFGGTVNVASRICGAAGPGRILISETTLHVAGIIGGASYADRGLFELKGLQQPQRLFEVDWSGAEAVRATPIASTRPLTPEYSSRSVAAPALPAKSMPPAARGKQSRGIRLGATAALLVTIVAAVTGVILLRPPAAAEPAPAELRQVAQVPAPVPASAAGGPRLLMSDDFSDPARGLFRDNQRGTQSVNVGGGVSIETRSEYAYADGKLIGRVNGEFPATGGSWPGSAGVWANSTRPVQEDFAMEVRARIVKGPSHARIVIAYRLPDADLQFNVIPALQTHRAALDVRPPLDPVPPQFMLDYVLASALDPGGENLFRFELQGDVARLFVNGQQINSVSYELLGRRGGTIQLGALVNRPMAERELEAQFSDFKVYAL